MTVDLKLWLYNYIGDISSKLILTLLHYFSTGPLISSLLFKWFHKLNGYYSDPHCTLMETSLTRLSDAGSIVATESGSTLSPTTIFPNMVPFSRIILVSCRVSIPSIPGTPCSVSLKVWTVWLMVIFLLFYEMATS